MGRQVGGAGVRRRPATRSGRPVIDPATIVATGLALLRRDGPASLTMAAVAAELGVTARAVYHWVPSRADLISRMLVEAQRSLPPAGNTGDWRADLHRYRDATFDWLDRFPGIIALAGDEGLGVVTEPVLHAQESALQLLCDQGLSPRTAHAWLAEFSRWVAGAHEQLRPIPGRTDGFEPVVASTQDAASDTHPLIRAAGTISAAEQVDVGFGWLLDTVERLIADERSDGPPRPSPDVVVRAGPAAEESTEGEG